jgi:hypothetical protein
VAMSRTSFVARMAARVPLLRLPGASISTKQVLAPDFYHLQGQGTPPN